MNPNPSSIGLLFDIYGAFWLAKAIIIRRYKDIEDETSTKYGYNLTARESQIKARFEGWIGFFFLSLGFTLQFVSSLFPDVSVSWEIFSTVALSLIIGGFGLAAFSHTLAHQARTEKQEDKIRKTEGVSNNNEQALKTHETRLNNIEKK